VHVEDCTGLIRFLFAILRARETQQFVVDLKKCAEFISGEAD
jgi:hypothetical protein